jgi:hypothetical protein
MSYSDPPVDRMWNGQWMIAIAAVLLPLALISEGDDYSDFRGPYCATRQSGCCYGRRDECSVPILGTLCYCDDFCNRTRSEDCCPDFWSFCLGMEPPLEIGSKYFHLLIFCWPQWPYYRILCDLTQCNTGNMGFPSTLSMNVFLYPTVFLSNGRGL